MSEQVSIRLFGRVDATVDGRTLDVPPGKPSLLLAVLAMDVGRVVPVDRVIDALWDADPPPSARALVHTYVSALRRGLAANGRVVETVPHGYRLGCRSDAVDLHRFLNAVASDDPAAWRHALAISAEPLLGAERAPFADPVRGRVDIVRRDLQERLWKRSIDDGHAVEVIPGLRAEVLERPFAEEPALLLAQALAISGRNEEAIGILDALRERVGTELGLDAAPRVVALRAEIAAPRPHADAAPATSLASGIPGGAADERANRSSVLARRSPRRWIIGAAVAAVLLGGSLWAAAAFGPFREAENPSPESRALVVLDPESGDLLTSIALDVQPAQLEVAGGRAWIRSETDHAVSYVDLSGGGDARTTGLPQAPTSIAVHDGVAYASLGFSGDVAPIADDGMQPPRQAVPGEDGRLTLAADDAGLWVATIGGEVHAPDAAPGWTSPVEVEGLPVRLAADPLATWVLTSNPDALVRLRSGETALPSALRGEPVDLASADGVAWAVTKGDERLWGTEAEGGRVTRAAVLPGEPVAVAVGADIVWVAIREPAALVGYRTQTLERYRSFDLAGEPADVGLANGLLVVALG